MTVFNKIYISKFSTKVAQDLDSWFVTGFTDAEGCFSISVQQDPRSKLGWVVYIAFSITLRKKDEAVLEKIKAYFKSMVKDSTNDLEIGVIYHSDETCCYRVKSVKQLAKVIEHFDKYPLVTKKRRDYVLFRESWDLMTRKEHLTEAGLNRIVSIRAELNKGLSEQLKQEFPNVLPASTSSLVAEGQEEIPNSSWLAGFVSGDGTFFVLLARSSASKFGYRVQLIFKLIQHTKDEELLKSLILYLKCGKYYRSWEDAGEYVCNKFIDIYSKVIPLFREYPIIGEKAKDFADWCKVAEIIKEGGHKTQEGLDKIRKIKEGMNRAR